METPGDPQGSCAETRPEFLQQTSAPRRQAAPPGTSVERWGRGQRGSARAPRPQTDRPSGRHGAGVPAEGPSGKCGERPRERQSELTAVIAPLVRTDASRRPALSGRCEGAVPLLLCPRRPRLPWVTLSAPAAGRKEPGSPGSPGRPLRAHPPARGRGSGGLRAPGQEPAPGALSTEANLACCFASLEFFLAHLILKYLPHF